MHDHVIVAVKRLGGFFQWIALVVSPTHHGDGVVGPDRPDQIFYVEIIHPTLPCHQRLSFVEVVIQQGLEKDLVGVRIILGAHDDTVQVQIHLFEQGVPQVVGDVEELCVVGIRRRVHVGHDAVCNSTVQS